MTSGWPSLMWPGWWSPGGRVRQVLGPLRTAHRNTTATTDREERPLVVEDDGRQAWLDRAACRDLLTILDPPCP